MKSHSFDYNFIDPHIHILPGVDDGSRDMSMSLAMLRVAAENHIDAMILTPHNKVFQHSVSPESQMRRIEELQAASDAAGFGITFYEGNECYYDETLVERLQAGEVMTLASSVYVLVEFYPLDPWARIQEGVRQLSYAGYDVVLAHVERYDEIVRHPERARDLVRAGVHLQVNAGDVVPHAFRNNTIPHFIRGLLDEGLVSLVGTDAHRPEGRAPLMNECAGWLAAHYDEDYVRAILRDNAEHVIYNEEMECARR